MIVRFQLSLDDLRRLNHEKQAEMRRRFSDGAAYKLWVYLLAPASVLTVAVISGSFLVAAVAFALMYGTSQLASRWGTSRYHRRYYTEANLGQNLLPFEVEVRPDRIVYTNPHSVYSRSWEGFQSLQETRRYLHLYVSPVSCLSVPKTAFGSEAELEAFRTAVNAHQSSLGQPPVP